QVVRTGTQQAKRDQDQSGGFIKVIKYALLAFAGIALFVGAFVIANTLAITIAQRTREFATLRTLGASRRQVMWSVVIEAFVIGVLGAVAGLFLGLGIAKLLNAAGVLLLFVGVSMNASKVVRPLASVLGAPAEALGGAPGILARDNATRNPARTASTASALMIGLALVTFVAIFGQGIRSSF